MNYSLFKPFVYNSGLFKKISTKYSETQILDNPILNKIEKIYSL